MISEIVFIEALPVPGQPNYIREPRFLASDGWRIERKGADVVLSHIDVGSITVSGIGYAYCEVADPPPKPAATRRRRNGDTRA